MRDSGVAAAAVVALVAALIRTTVMSAVVFQNFHPMLPLKVTHVALESHTVLGGGGLNFW